MAQHRHRLPQLDDRQLFLTDGGLETTLIFHKGIELPHFAAFDLLRTIEGREILRNYYRPYIEAAKTGGYGFVLDTPTWRANADWGAKLGYSREALAAANRDAISLMVELRDEYEATVAPMVVSGAIGPRGDGYIAGEIMSVEMAEAYHAEQIATFADSAADMIGAFTLTNINEGIGIARAARAAGMPVAISFTLETDGRLPSGDHLGEAIGALDGATDGWPAYYMINCAHPTHFATTLADGSPWLKRLRGLRANASKRSHAELNEAPDLDAGNPDELGAQYRKLVHRFPHITVVGGCCGTDDRHIACIGAACKTPAAA